MILPSKTVERAASELRRGLPLAVLAEDRLWTLAAMETLSRSAILAKGAVELAVSAPLAVRLGGPNAPTRVEYSSAALACEAFEALVASEAPPRPLAFCPAGEAGEAALKLTRIARLMPAALLVPLARKPKEMLEIFLGALNGYDLSLAARVERVSKANIPLKAGLTARVIAYRTPLGENDHLALVIGALPAGKPPLARVHSSCLTGDILGSLRCDCGDQLAAALARIAEEGGGVLLYLNQEGRGIGISSKLRAYALQEQGMDTVEANLALGYGADERDFGVAAAILKDLGLDAVRLLTNNPAKVTALNAAGIAVKERVPLAVPSNGHNDFYLATKALKCGHAL